MKKEKNLFEIDGVGYSAYEYEMTKDEILKELDFFRKSNRPSYLFINALLQIKQNQERMEYFEKRQNRLEKEIDEIHQRTVLYWTILVIGLVGFFTIISFLIDLIK